MLSREWYRPLSTGGFANPFLRKEDVSSLIPDATPLDDQPKLKQRIDVDEDTRIRQLISSGVNSDIAYVIDSIQIGEEIERIKTRAYFLCSFGNSKRRKYQAGQMVSSSEFDRFYVVGGVAARFAYDVGTKIALRLLEVSSNGQDDSQFVVNNDMLSKVYSEFSDEFPDVISAHLTMQDPGGELLLVVENIDDDQLDAVAAECTFSFLSSLAGSGCAVLLTGILDNPLRKFIAVFKPAQVEREVEPEEIDVLAGKVIRSTSIMAAVGLLHLTLASDYVSSKYFGTALSLRHRSGDCVLMQETGMVWNNFVMQVCILADLVRSIDMQELKKWKPLVKSTLTNRTTTSPRYDTNNVVSYIDNALKNKWRADESIPEQLRRVQAPLEPTLDETDEEDISDEGRRILQRKEFLMLIRKLILVPKGKWKWPLPVTTEPDIIEASKSSELVAALVDPPNLLEVVSREFEEDVSVIKLYKETAVYKLLTMDTTYAQQDFELFRRRVVPILFEQRSGEFRTIKGFREIFKESDELNMAWPEFYELLIRAEDLFFDVELYSSNESTLSMVKELQEVWDSKLNTLGEMLTQAIPENFNLLELNTFEGRKKATKSIKENQEAIEIARQEQLKETAEKAAKDEFRRMNLKLGESIYTHMKWMWEDVEATMSKLGEADFAFDLYLGPGKKQAGTGTYNLFGYTNQDKQAFKSILLMLNTWEQYEIEKTVTDTSVEIVGKNQTKTVTTERKVRVPGSIMDLDPSQRDLWHQNGYKVKQVAVNTLFEATELVNAFGNTSWCLEDLPWLIRAVHWRLHELKEERKQTPFGPKNFGQNLKTLEQFLWKDTADGKSGKAANGAIVNRYEKDIEPPVRTHDQKKWSVRDWALVQLSYRLPAFENKTGKKVWKKPQILPIREITNATIDGGQKVYVPISRRTWETSKKDYQGLLYPILRDTLSMTSPEHTSIEPKWDPQWVFPLVPYGIPPNTIDNSPELNAFEDAGEFDATSFANNFKLWTGIKIRTPFPRGGAGPGGGGGPPPGMMNLLQGGLKGGLNNLKKTGGPKKDAEGPKKAAEPKKDKETLRKEKLEKDKGRSKLPLPAIEHGIEPYESKLGILYMGIQRRQYAKAETLKAREVAATRLMQQTEVHNKVAIMPLCGGKLDILPVDDAEFGASAEAAGFTPVDSSTYSDLIERLHTSLTNSVLQSGKISALKSSPVSCLDAVLSIAVAAVNQ